ncbi:hypothetical protein ET475_12035 [Microbacterium protaetiae]|uniref:Fido domain-containing protein n=1 Tax=Microbacterium protaetiae TaxID=2509458 RepID=A0A4P6EGQ5_9MICO|nr:hypothetical protein [Microbacterium protaetiae]QAY60643.1 hypothetical protein ET475_12035 [Microbacterium protaetiae]
MISSRYARSESRRPDIGFGAATRAQYYFDGNKRTARLLMSGELMAHGFDVVNIPHARRLEYNVALDEMFTTDDATTLLLFLTSCALPGP